MMILLNVALGCPANGVIMSRFVGEKVGVFLPLVSVRPTTLLNALNDCRPTMRRDKEGKQGLLQVTTDRLIVQPMVIERATGKTKERSSRVEQF